MVRIELVDLDESDEFGDRLCGLLGLKAVRVLESGNVASLASQVGTLLTEANLGAGSVVAIGWGRTVQSLIAAGLPELPGVVVVPATGGMHETASHFQINEFVRTAAEQMGGEARFLHAGLIASAELRAVLRRDPDTARILEFWSRTDAAILGIGEFQKASRRPGVRFPDDDAGRIVGDVVRHYYDEHGGEIRWEGQEDLMAISREELRRIPLSIGVAVGKEKVMAILGAARSGMINALVTDTQVARLLLDHLDRSGETAPKEAG
nr:sugar-binding domain-containing protein [Aurantimonas sp. VKM B-3413]